MNLKRTGIVALVGFVTGVIFALLGGSIGWLLAKWSDPTGWNTLPYAIAGLVIGYAPGVALGCWLAHLRFGGKRSFNWALFPALTALFMVVFLSQPLNLDTLPALMWTILFILPDAVTAWFMKIKD